MRAIIFDCDGTLVDSAPLYARAWAAGFAAAGATMDEQWYRFRAGLSENILIDSFERENGITLDRGVVVATVRTSFLEDIANLAEIKAITAIARQARGRLPMAVASGGPAAIVYPSLDKTGLRELFDAIVTFDDVGVAKPAPDLFLYAAKCLGVPPELCLVFEDSDTGIQAAKNAGMNYIDVRNSGNVKLWQRCHARLENDKTLGNIQRSY